MLAGHFAGERQGVLTARQPALAVDRCADDAAAVLQLHVLGLEAEGFDCRRIDGGQRGVMHLGAGGLAVFEPCGLVFELDGDAVTGVGLFGFGGRNAAELQICISAGRREQRLGGLLAVFVNGKGRFVQRLHRFFERRFHSALGERRLGVAGRQVERAGFDNRQLLALLCGVDRVVIGGNNVLRCCRRFFRGRLDGGLFGVVLRRFVGAFSLRLGGDIHRLCLGRRGGAGGIDIVVQVEASVFAHAEAAQKREQQHEHKRRCLDVFTHKIRSSPEKSCLTIKIQ